MNRYLKFLLVGLIIFIPSFVLAQSGGFQSIIRILMDMVRQLSILAMGVATLVFFWGLVKFILNTGSGSEAEQAKGIMFWGIIALFVMFSVWGLVRLIQNTFQIRQGGALPFPELPTNNTGGTNL